MMLVMLDSLGLPVTVQKLFPRFVSRCTAAPREFDAWERKVRQRIEERYGMRLPDTGRELVDLFREIELQRRANTRQ